MGTFARSALVGSLILLAPGIASAQGIRGVVLDAETGLPVGAAAVALLDAREAPVGRVLSDTAGGFSLPVRQSGRYHLRAERIGYATVTSPPLDLVVGDTLVVELILGVDVVTLAPLTVTVASRNNLRNRALDGFYARQRRGWGTFFGPREIEHLRPWSIVNVLQTAPGVNIRYGRGTRTTITMRATGGRDCRPTVYVDGLRAISDELDSWVVGSAIRAVEVYRRNMEVPAEFASVQNWDCGAIVVWTSLTVDP
jgi:hypothetical protein